MASNKIATVLLLDVGAGTSTKENGKTFFQRAKDHLKRTILKKMIAEDTDEMALILFGDDVTNNDLHRTGANYAHTNVLHPLKIPTVPDLFLKLQDINIAKCEISDWVQGCIVAIDLMKNQSKGKRYKTKQIILISNFETEVTYKRSMYSTLIACFNSEKIKLIVLGVDEEYIQKSPHLKPLDDVLSQMIIPSLCCNFEDLEEDNKFFDKKRRMKRVTNINLEIGSNIKIPVGWVKLTSDPHRFKWSRPDTAVVIKLPVDGNSKPLADVASKTTGEGNLIPDDDMSDFMSVASSVEKTKFSKYGDTSVQLSYGDLESLKRNSGPPVFQIMMFTKKKNVNPAMFIGGDVYSVIPKDENRKGQAAFYALIDAMIAAEKFAIAKRIVINNGLVMIGALIPFSDESGKHMYFLKLPTAEWVQPYPRVRTVEAKQDRAALMDRLIDTMTLRSDLVEEDKGILVQDPSFQLKCHVIAEKLEDPKCTPTIPESIQEILNIPVFDPPGAKEVLQSLLDELPHLNTDVRTAASLPGRVPRLKVTRPESPQHNNDGDPSASAPAPSGHQDSPSVLLNSQVTQGDTDDIKRAFFS